MLERICTTLYDVFRPLIIHINHLETLSELCSILKGEMMEEHVKQNRGFFSFSLYFSLSFFFSLSPSFFLLINCFSILKKDSFSRSQSLGSHKFPGTVRDFKVYRQEIKKKKHIFKLLSKPEKKEEKYKKR